MTKDFESDREKQLAEFLTGSSDRLVLNWLTDRLGGDDVLISLDRKSGEDPEAFVVSFIRRRGLNDPAVLKLSRSIRAMLRQIDQCRPTLDPQHHALIRLCQQVFVPLASDWFVKHLKGLPVDAPLDPLDDAIARAAVVHANAADNPALRTDWERLLRTKRYATVALHGIARSWVNQMPYTHTWWNAESSPVRERELRYFVAAAVREAGVADFVAALKATSSQWPQGLKDSIDRALALAGEQRLFRTAQQCAIRNALDGAARRRELVLEQTA